MFIALKRIRLSQNMTQKELAQLAGIKRTMICMLEWGQRRGSLQTWDRLEEVLGVDQKILRRVDADDAKHTAKVNENA
ncbi:MAG: helix-turn-helix transcriptional regulator [Deltaproteobacteria bacterium]|jgi:transcriptional regulator with XRE-family HTH domain|nr:helix-turn-helix transcriptional regulator [Deltaproteobacteria bacterium]